MASLAWKEKENKFTGVLFDSFIDFHENFFSTIYRSQTALKLARLACGFKSVPNIHG